MHKILCFIGLHDYRVTIYSTKKCAYCGKITSV